METINLTDVLPEDKALIESWALAKVDTTWTGSGLLVTLGTIGTGVWQGTAIADAYVAGASGWDGKQDALTFGIADNNAVEIDSANVATGEYAKFTANGLESKAYSEMKTDLGYLTDLVDDTSPQLGGDLDCSGKTLNKSAVRQAADIAPSTGQTATFDYSAADMIQVTCPTAGTITFAVSNFPSGDVAGYIVDVVNGGNASSVTHPAAWLFASGTAPAYTADGTDRILLISDKDGVITLHVSEKDIKTV